MKSNYFDKRESRIERYKELSAKLGSLSASSYERAHKLGNMIPMGQPILVGHHSERGHRAHIKKIDNAMRASVEQGQKSRYYEDRAEAAENNRAISSDNPDALRLLEEKLENMQKAQECWKAINKILKSKKLGDVEKVAELVKIPMREITAIEILSPDRYGRVGIPSYKLTNNNGNMARVKERIKQLSRVADMEDVEVEISGVKILSSAQTNRVQIFFPSKPADNVRTDLKRDGFRWAPSEGAWQRNLSSWAHKLALDIVKKHYPENIV